MKIFDILRENQQRDLMDLKRSKRWGDLYNGSLDCDNMSLTSLKGAPRKVVGYFYCDNNNLTSLKWAPSWVGGDFYCSDNNLTSLEWAPNWVGKDFYCVKNQITSLEGAPDQVGGEFGCDRNQLSSLVGAPTKVGQHFYCDNNPIESLAGIGSYFKNGYIKGTLVVPGSVKSHMLGILLIPELKKFDAIGNSSNNTLNATKIINKHLHADKDILECQEELRSAGLREFGKL